MKIVITNGYTWNNSGDAGIIIGTIAMLRQTFGKDTEVTVFTATPELDQKMYNKSGVRARFLDHMLIMPKKYLGVIPYNSYFLIPQTCLGILKLSLRKWYLDECRENYKALKNADLIIVCGGGFLGGNNFFGNLCQLYQVKVNLRYHKKVIVLGDSVEPADKWYICAMLKSTLRRVDHFYSREYITTDFLRNALKLLTVSEIPDMAFFFDKMDAPVQIREYYKLEHGQIIIGITLRDCFKKSEYIKCKEDYIKAIVKFISEIIDKFQCFLCCIPFCRNDGDDDRIISEEVIDKLDNKYKKNMQLLDYEMSPAELKGLIQQMDYFVGTRMHSNIFAMSVGIPVIALKYEEKTQGIMEMMGMADYVFNAYYPDVDAMVKSLERQMKERDKITDKLKKTVNKFKGKITEELRGYLCVE